MIITITIITMITINKIILAKYFNYIVKSVKMEYKI